jgi:hypothetical protein
MIPNNKNSLTAIEKQKKWRIRQISIFYGSGRPIFKISNDNQFIRQNYDGEYYTETQKYNDLDNKNYIEWK